jgi:hypothetical protein
MQAGNQVLVSIPSGTLLTATLAQNAALNARVPLPEAIAAGRHGRSIIRSIRVVSFDTNDWEFWFWRNKQFQNSGHPDLESFAGLAVLLATNNKRIGAAGMYYYYLGALDIPYEVNDPLDIDRPFLNVTLINRSAGAKTVNAWFDCSFSLEPTLGV